MPRHKDPEALIIDAPTSQLIDQDASAAHDLSVLNREIDQATRQAAAMVGYSLPGDSTDPDLIQRDIATNIRRTAETAIEIGRALIVLKHACGHGQFGKRLANLSLSADLASRLMSVARKFPNLLSNTKMLAAIGNQTKLLEMIALDDEQIEELELFGQTGELSLDDVSRMSVKDLRAALRKERQTNEAIRRVIADKDNKINEISEQLHQHRLTPPRPDEVGDELRNALQLAVGVVEANLRGTVHQAIIALAEHNESTGIDHKQYIAGLLAQAEVAFAALREQHNIPDRPTADPTPDWMRQRTPEEERQALDAMAEGTDWTFDQDGNMVPRVQ